MAVVQYTFAHKQYTKQHHETEYNTVEQNKESTIYITIRVHIHKIGIYKHNKNT